MLGMGWRNSLSKTGRSLKHVVDAKHLAWALWALVLLVALLTLSIAAISPASVLRFVAIGVLVAGLPCATAGALIAAHRPGNALGRVLFVVGALQILTNFAVVYGRYALLVHLGALPLGSEMIWIGQWSWIPSLALMPTFGLLLFPNGRLPSPRWRWIAWPTAVVIAMDVTLVAWTLWPARGLPSLCDQRAGEVDQEALARLCPSAQAAHQLGTSSDALVLAVFVIVVIVAVASVISLFVRFQRARGVERQQLKWFAFGSAVGVAGMILAFATEWQIPVYVPFLTLPATIAIAILRYRLYDIDIIVNRTLVYAVLTAALALVYYGSVLVLQQLFRQVTGQASQLAVVTSTLVIAWLFQPLRHRIQAFIDRRFYRRKYDAVQALQSFSSRLRDDIELRQLTNDIVQVVQETLEPEHVSLWLRPTTSRGETDV